MQRFVDLTESLRSQLQYIALQLPCVTSANEMQNVDGTGNQRSATTTTETISSGLQGCATGWALESYQASVCDSVFRLCQNSAAFCFNTQDQGGIRWTRQTVKFWWSTLSCSPWETREIDRYVRIGRKTKPQLTVIFPERKTPAFWKTPAVCCWHLAPEQWRPMSSVDRQSRRCPHCGHSSITLCSDLPWVRLWTIPLDYSLHSLLFIGSQPSTLLRHASGDCPQWQLLNTVPWFNQTPSTHSLHNSGCHGVFGKRTSLHALQKCNQHLLRRQKSCRSGSHRWNHLS